MRERPIFVREGILAGLLLRFAALVASIGLSDDALTRVVDLPYGKQRLVEIAIALGLKPKVLLLDEPAAGVPSMESQRILEVLDRLPAEIAILIIEHDMDHARGNRARPPRARGLPRRAAPWLRFCK